jgi:hypothetical protein
MKKVLLLLMLVATICVDSYAQTPTRNKRFTAVTRRTGGVDVNGTIKAADTLTNADTGTIGHAVNYAYDLSFNYTVTRLSGTLAGNVSLYGTNDSLNGPWVLIKADTSQCPSCALSTGTFTNAASNRFVYRVPRSPFTYYRLQTITSGTVTATHSLITDYKY